MSGLVKGKNYDWKDSNMAKFGSDEDKKVKKEAAETEPAWEGAGQEVGLKIWRINQFQVEAVPEGDYGLFYKGDSYVVLNTYLKNPDSEALSYDVHFWIGKESTQDEYGTAAYKTVELDAFLDDKAVQYREVQQNESQLFLSYFQEMTYMNGGYASGFRSVEPTEYQPRLLCIKYTNGKTVAAEVPYCKSSVTPDDVFIVDSGTNFVQLNGSGAALQEKSKAMDTLSKLSESRPNAEKTVCDEGDSDYRRCVASLSDEDPEAEEDVDMSSVETPVLAKISDSDGSMDVEVIKEGEISMDDLDSNDVFLIHVKDCCYCWIGSGASIDEKRNGFYYADKYLKEIANKPFEKICVIPENDDRCSKIAEALAA